MSEEKTNLEVLEAIRAELVAERREFAKTALKPIGTGSLSKAGALKELVQTQADIEVVDRAILDEEALRPSVYETRGMLNI